MECVHLHTTSGLLELCKEISSRIDNYFVLVMIASCRKLTMSGGAL